MKKTYLQFPSWKQLNAAPKITKRFATMAAYKSDAPVVELTDETDPENKIAADDSSEIQALKKIARQVKQFNTVLGEKAKKEDFDSLKAQLDTLTKDIGTMKADDISKAIEKINESNEKIWKQIVEMQEENARKKEEGEGKAKKGQLFTTKDVEAFVKATFNERGEKTHNMARIEMKAAETMGVANFFSGADVVTDAFTGRVVDPTLYQRKRKRNLILDNFTIGSIAVPKLIFLVKVEEGNSSSVSGDPGGADWILSSEAKPKRSFRVTTGEVEAKKVAIFGTLEDKLLKDVASLENWVRDDFMMEMSETINDGLLNNDTGTNPKAPQGMKQDAIQFTATDAFDGTIDDPNYIDAILAICALMSDNKEEAGQIFVASDVYYRIMGLKDSQGRYQNNTLVYVNNLGQLFIGGVRIIMADSDDIPSTHVLCTAVDLGFKMLAYGPLVFERGLNGEDFRYDRTSYRGYQEFLSYLPTHRENSVLYDTWENIFAAITTGS
jgi:HK97 family phage major capsid protein